MMLVSPEEWSEVYRAYIPGKDEFFPPYELPLAKAIRGEESDGVEMVIRNPREQQRYNISVTGRPLRTEEGILKGGVIVIRDVTAQRRASEELELKAKELARSNSELSQFAYVASHDLQEPLRMVTNYLQLLQRRYGGRLDADADEFIGYAVDGALRMQRLIHDLLAYSRVGTRGRAFEAVELGGILEKAKTNLKLALEESGAEIKSDGLPQVQGDATQLIQLFQNLLANAIKFRGDESPRVHVSAQQEDGEWIVEVADNGIGIDAGQADRIFLLFQRLHTRREYPGTGIGLAICKKIVERHGGRIWVESEPGQGSRFRFTLPQWDGQD